MKNILKILLGLLFIIAGVVGGIYLGFWVMFVGGILEIARAIDLHTVTAMLIAINIIKIFFAFVVGLIIGVLGISVGATILA